MDSFTKSVLVVIACSLLAIAVKMWLPGYATLGELETISTAQEGPAQDAAFAAWSSRLVMVRMQGGTVGVDVDVRSIPTVDVDVTSMP